MPGNHIVISKNPAIKKFYIFPLWLMISANFEAVFFTILSIFNSRSVNFFTVNKIYTSPYLIQNY